MCCNGKLSDCEYIGVCAHLCRQIQQKLEFYAVVSCSNVIINTTCMSVAIIIQYTTAIGECNETHDVRLVGGTTHDGGQVEICLDGVWRSVCDPRWDYRDTEVVCRQLHYDECKPQSFIIMHSYIHSLFPLSILSSAGLFRL